MVVSRVLGRVQSRFNRSGKISLFTGVMQAARGSTCKGQGFSGVAQAAELMQEPGLQYGVEKAAEGMHE